MLDVRDPGVCCGRGVLAGPLTVTIALVEGATRPAGPLRDPISSSAPGRREPRRRGQRPGAAVETNRSSSSRKVGQPGSALVSR